MIPVILSGGSGTRLWPLSRKLFPKQFHSLGGEQSLFQMTLERLGGNRRPIVICNEEHRFLVAEQMREGGVEWEKIILEPVGKNTAPAIAVAAFSVSKEDPLLLVLPSDHVIDQVEVFKDAVEKAKEYANQGKLVTFGIQPTGPNTEYGYIKARKGSDAIDRFIEKPILEDAERFVGSGEYFWNSGMFLFKASSYLKALKEFKPEIYELASQAYKKATSDLDFIRLDSEIFSKCPSVSIDYAVMEKTKEGIVVPLRTGWSDLGSWYALWETGKKDGQGNVMAGDVLVQGTRNCFLMSDEKLLVTVGVENLVVVDTADAILVAKQDSSLAVKEIVSKMAAKGRKEVTNHRKVYRPWGYFDSLLSGERFQVKTIVVKPGGILSLQYHHHRAEHWVVVKGTAKVTRGDEVFFVSENQSTYIPIGTSHRLENPGTIPLEMIEVQSGSYLGEDDIVRLEDSYGRADEKACVE